MSNPPLFPLQPTLHSRRSFIGGSASLLLALTAGRAVAATDRISHHPSFTDYPFQLGVASGEPDHEGFVIWTRLAPQPLADGGVIEDAIQVHWMVAEDEAMTKVVAKGTAVAQRDWAHSVHVEVTGLRPDRWYWYQFKAGAEISPIGRSRTLESPDRTAAQTSMLRMAFASCQHFETGFYNAYEHMLAEAPDIVFHLGDYIYEGSSRDGQVRRHSGKEIKTLDAYRRRHAQYKCDPALQAMHQAAPWVVTWDDHEFDNNYAGDIPEEKGPAEHEAFLQRRAAAYQAYYEHMPLRAACVPKGPGMSLYRRLQHGQLVNFHVLDTRQYRTDQPQGDGLRPPSPAEMNPEGTLLGHAQREWLLAGLTASNTTWNVLAQQVMMARADRKAGEAEAYSMDQWPGYEFERRHLLQAFDERKISNPVVITGDIHNHWANELLTDFDPASNKVVGHEFVCSSITSGGDGVERPKYYDDLISENPCVKYHGNRRGYVSCMIRPDQWRTDYRSVEYVSRPHSPIDTPASFVIENTEMHPA
ncbi:alkaline phosphatase D [Haloferula luteola]|uniref:Alkaline phosphatase D n=1 Tax=Haloferula luteola TaxID=595692 RepID=A0A840V4E1_9BACT|nr:alkaline phosphatase D family protein [Haloferula luteola]MBB5351916.1 alkaline phosphatase D [Haloferula luteola]